MSAPPANLPGWTRRRFWCVAGALFAAQAGLILLFAEGGRGAARVMPANSHLHVLGTPLTSDQLSRTFFAMDPIAFPLPGPHGFSKRAWLQPPAEQFEVPVETQAPKWREIDATRLGTNFPLLNRPISPLPFGLADDSGAELEPWPIALTPDEVKSQSVLEISGELARRQLNNPGDLRAWPSSQLLSNSVVQIAVDSAGQVVAARLLSRSGLADADTNALDKARSLRFRPVPASPPVWGKAVFEWQTVEQTNATPVTLP